MRSPMDELVFAAHSQHAVAEMQALGDDTAARITDSPALTEMLRRPEAPTRQFSRAARCRLPQAISPDRSHLSQDCPASMCLRPGTV
jgi:hypothetical protein